MMSTDSSVTDPVAEIRDLIKGYESEETGGHMLIETARQHFEMLKIDYDRMADAYARGWAQVAKCRKRIGELKTEIQAKGAIDGR